MLESVSHLFSSTTCAATHVDGEGGESDLAPTDPDECPEACDVWGETSDLVRTDQNLCAENHVDRTLEAMKCAKTNHVLFPSGELHLERSHRCQRLLLPSTF